MRKYCSEWRISRRTLSGSRPRPLPSARKPAPRWPSWRAMLAWRPISIHQFRRGHLKCVQFGKADLEGFIVVLAGMELLLEIFVDAEILNSLDVPGAGPERNAIKQMVYVLHNRNRQRRKILD